MSVDTYAVCPCGSGKKIKFCKCKDSVSDLERVLKMVEGGQVVPALDRLAAILQEHPDAAWALAVRGRLLLDLREYKSLSENADRFIRLQPANPLALTQRAAAFLFRGELDSATESLLGALTESGLEVDSFVLDVASALAYALAQHGAFLTARVYGTLAMMAPGYEGGQTAIRVLQELNTAAAVNTLLKSIPPSIPRPADVDWAERFDEASGLLNNNQVVLAESKFDSLRRSQPDQPAVLSGLLTCAIWRGDTSAQSQLLGRLSEIESLDFEQRVQMRALSVLVEPGNPQLSVDVLTLQADIQSPEEVEMALMSNSRLISLPPDMVGSVKTAPDDVPPRAGFQILDRDKPESLEQLPPVDEVPEAIAMVFIYGRQTDREARIELHDVRESNAEAIRELLADALGDAKLEAGSNESLPLLMACQPPVAMIRFQAKPAEAEVLQAELSRTRMPAAITTAKLPFLEGKSLQDLKGDESKLLERTVVVRIVEQFDAIVSKGDQIVGEVYDLAGLEPLPPLKLSDTEIETLDNVDLNRVDPSGLSVESLLYLMRRAQQISATPAMRCFASRLIESEVSQEEVPAKMLAHVVMVNTSPGSSQALEWLEKAKAFAEQHELSIANLLLSEVSLRLNAGDGQGFQNAIQTLTSRHGNDPEVMAQLQQMLMSYGLISPDGSPRQAPSGPASGPVPAAASPSQAGGIWTPGDPSPPPAGPPAQEGGGENKLWVPGMD